MLNDLVHRLRERARIRRQIPSRRSVQEGQPDRISDLLDEAADEIEFWGRRMTCASCGAKDQTRIEWKDEIIPHAIFGDVPCRLPVISCSACGISYTDKESEEIREKAVREAQSRKTQEWLGSEPPIPIDMQPSDLHHPASAYQKVEQAQARAKSRAWIVTSPSGKVLHVSEHDGWTVEQVIGT